ncbi:MAG: regulatory protein RecX [Desulfamplus sp.]|nr:regulatory protein RecX [Desulfamplus sp.]
MLKTINTKGIFSPYELSIRYLALRARSVKEMRLYLAKKGFDEEVIQQTLSKLKDENLLSDQQFASMFVEQRERFKPKSKFALAFELKQKGVDPATIDSSLSEVDEYSSALSAVEPKLRLWQNYEPELLKKKVMNFLRNRGFSYEVCVATFNKIVINFLN